MMLQRNESVVITVNICIRIWFNKCAVDGVLTAPILAQTNWVRRSATNCCPYMSCWNANATALRAQWPFAGWYILAFHIHCEKQTFNLINHSTNPAMFFCCMWHTRTYMAARKYTKIYEINMSGRQQKIFGFGETNSFSGCESTITTQRNHNIPRISFTTKKEGNKRKMRHKSQTNEKKI